MALKVELTGVIDSFRQHNETMFCLEVKSGKSPTAPKGLPATTDDIHFTVVINGKQRSKLVPDEELVGRWVKVSGGITLDVAFDILTGDLCLVATNIEDITESKLQADEEKKAKAKLKSEEVSLRAEEVKPDLVPEPQVVAPLTKTPENLVKLDSIVIPEDFKMFSPNRKKIVDAIASYKKNARFDKPITVKKIGNEIVLTDGYARYVAAVEMGLIDVEVKFWSESDKQKAM